MSKLLRWGAPGLIALGALYVIGFVVYQQYVAEPSLTFSIRSGSADVAPGTPIGLTTAGWDTQITSAELRRATLDERGVWGPSEEVPAQVALEPLESRPGELVGRVRAADGSDPVVPDARLTLTLRGSAKELAFPLPVPREVTIERRLEFSTRLSPRPDVPQRPVSLRYGEDVVVKWSAPMRSFDVTATPRARVDVVLDPGKPNVTTLALPDAREGQEYVVTIQGAIASNGVPLQKPYSLRVITPVSPQPTLPPEPVGLRPDQRQVTIGWNVPLESIQGTVSGNAKARWSIDGLDPRVVHLDFDEYSQGQTYQASIVRATARNGAPLAHAATFQVTTPEPLRLEAASPESGARGVAVSAPVSFTFSEPIADHAAAERAIQLEPAIPGHFEWPDERTVSFVPDQGWPHDSNVSVRLKGGPGTVVGQSGGFYPDQQTVTFSTPPDKKIEVVLSEQKLYLWEGGEVVRSFPVATGVRGADTPVGDFEVQYKMEKARFRGTNPSGRTYDIPDVHWVLAFQGDYTIHGAYWRQAFGTPGSNGCVSLTDPDAKVVFDWATEGTPISIHD
jgi:lipoprotein-anchoring transpeptidase ErfK/SrfK